MDDLLLDTACGIGSDGATLSTAMSDAAVKQLVDSGRFTPESIAEFRQRRLSEILRDDTGRIRGCSSPQCDRAAVWQRVFEKSPNASRMMLDVLGAATAVMSGNVSPLMASMMAGSVNFTDYRLGEEDRDDYTVAIQYGCWAHAESFVAIPATGGRYVYSIMEALLPKQRPHEVFGISEENWQVLQTAERAQNLGRPEGPRAFCVHCGMPYCPLTLKGLQLGTGKDYWRTFCVSCGADVKPTDDESGAQV